MSQIILHFLNAQETLTDHCEWLTRCLTNTYERAQRAMPLPCLDVVVKSGGYVIPEKGHLGFCPDSSVVYVSIDPENSAFRENEAHSLERMFAHELHHAARWAGPGYGSTLGEAIVSEGLAGHFSLELFAGEPEIWESLNPGIMYDYIQQLRENWHQTNYDHNAWFYGSKDLPRWLGYTAGFNLVSKFLAARTQLKASMLANLEAEEFRPFI